MQAINAAFLPSSKARKTSGKRINRTWREAGKGEPFESRTLCGSPSREEMNASRDGAVKGDHWLEGENSRACLESLSLKSRDSQEERWNVQAQSQTRAQKQHEHGGDQNRRRWLCSPRTVCSQEGSQRTTSELRRKRMQ